MSHKSRKGFGLGEKNEKVVNGEVKLTARERC